VAGLSLACGPAAVGRRPDAQFIAVEPLLTPLSGEPRFQALKRSLGL
jgi:hypothetical protein